MTSFLHGWWEQSWDGKGSSLREDMAWTSDPPHRGGLLSCAKAWTIRYEIMAWIARCENITVLDSKMNIEA